MAELDDDALLAALGVEVAPAKAASHTPREERLIAGFEDILRFHAAYGRAPRHDPDGDIFERLYAVRLDQLRKLPESLALLAPLDTPGLLGQAPPPAAIDDDALLAELGAEDTDITVLRHVRPHAQIKAAEEIADRTPCADFAQFQPLFDEVETGLRQGRWVARPFGRNASVEVGDFFVLGGVTAYVAAVGDTYKTPNAETNARLRVIYANGTESNLLLRSLQRALYKDNEGRTGSRLVRLDAGPLFGNVVEPDDIATGTIYVLRSRSTHPFIAAHRELIHKIGVTGGKVATRVAHAEHDATYLLAGVDVVAEYKLHNIRRVHMETLFHRLFDAARIDITIDDRFGHPVRPQEWFLVPLAVIDETVRRIVDGSITGYVYDPATATLRVATSGN